MADLTGDTPLEPDIVTCVCGLKWDRNIYSQCSNCPTNLWELDRAAPPKPARAANSTVLEGGPPPAARLIVHACGRQLTIAEGQSLQLGRQDDLETAEVFRCANNVSRAHALLRLDHGKLHVTDTQSTNGTFVDGQRLPPDVEYEIRQGQTLRLASNIEVEILWEIT